MELNSQTKRLGETILIACIVIAFTGWWANGISHTKEDAYQAYKRAQVATIAQALRFYQVDFGRYPQVVDNLPFCAPFDMYDDERCLGELLGPYLQPDAVSFDDNSYVYMDRPGYVFIAADINADAGVTTSNRCLIKDFEFWCIKLKK